MMLAAGVLLFVAAHWDALSPGRRFAVVLAAVAGLHIAAVAAAERSSGLGLTLHACGTAALGGGIFLAGQIFHLQEHWPGGLLLWAVGAAAGWWLLRDWPQALLAALLAPAWLMGEWVVATQDRRGAAPLAAGVVALALAYFGAEPAPGGRITPVRRGLVWIGGLAIIPAVLFLVIASPGGSYRSPPLPVQQLVGWGLALGIPLAVGWLLRGRGAGPLAVGVLWAGLGPFLARAGEGVPYLWSGLLSVGLIGWGVLERRSERINLGIAGFALTVTVFYFSSVMDRLGRSASLIGLGILFLGGGYLLDRARRRLLARLEDAA